MTRVLWWYYTRAVVVFGEYCQLAYSEELYWPQYRSCNTPMGVSNLVLFSSYTCSLLEMLRKFCPCVRAQYGWYTCSRPHSQVWIAKLTLSLSKVINFKLYKIIHHTVFHSSLFGLVFCSFQDRKQRMSLLLQDLFLLCVMLQGI